MAKVAKTLDDMVKKGKRNYRRKISVMVDRYTDEETKERAIKNFKDLPFGKSIIAAYESAWEDMPDNYKDAVKEGLEEKWGENWKKKIQM